MPDKFLDGLESNQRSEGLPNNWLTFEFKTTGDLA